MEMNDEEKKVLKACNREPGEIEELHTSTKIDTEKLKKILEKLQKQGLVYNYDETWSATVQGIKELR